MSASLRTRLANAACAFQTGHSVRDLRRVRKSALLLLARRLAERHRREAAMVSSETLRASALSRAEAIEDAIKRLSKASDRKIETFLSHALDLDRAFLRTLWRSETAQRVGLGHLDEFSGNDREILRMAGGELRCQLYESLFEDRRFDFLADEQFVGRWDWHHFFHFVRFQIRRAVRSFSGRGPP